MPENPSGPATPVGGVTTTSSQPVPATPSTITPTPIGGSTEPAPQPVPSPTPIGGVTPQPTPVGGTSTSPPPTPVRTEPGTPTSVTPLPGGAQPGTVPQPGTAPQPGTWPQPVGGKFSADDVKDFWVHSVEAFAGFATALAKKLAGALRA